MTRVRATASLLPAASCLETEHGAQEPSSSSSPAEGVNGDSNAGQAPVSDAEAARIAKEQAKQRKYRSPLPQGVPLPVAEHDSLHTYVQRARNISVFSIAFTLACAIVGLSFAWGTNRCEIRTAPRCH